MTAIIVEAEVGQDQRLIDVLPPEVPVGRVKLVIEPVEGPAPDRKEPLTRDEARRRILAAGMLLTEPVALEGFVESDEAEHRRLMELFGQGPSSDQLTDEDRGPRE